MDTPKKDKILADNLYQIPTCTICLQQLSQDLTALACGHCFHFLCITQHFEYKGTCPNCQKRAGLKQARSIHFPLVKNNKISAHMDIILSSLSSSQKKQMEEILKQLKIQSQQAEKLGSQNIQMQIDLKTKTTHLQNLREDLNSRKKDIEILRKDNLQLSQERDSLRTHLRDSQRSEAFLSTKIDKLQLQLKDYEQFKRYKRIMNENSQQLLKMKEEMQYKQTSPVEMAKQFFQICQIGKLEEGKYRQKLREAQLKVDYQEQETLKLKETQQKLEKEIERLLLKVASQRKRAEENESKYKRLREKSLQSEEKEQSNAISNASKKIHKNQPTKSSKSLIQTTLQQNFEMLAENSIRKPTFSATAKFGGLTFRKKDDTIRPFK